MENLNDFIRKLRHTKTALEEKNIIDKECALIRTAFKDEGFNSFRNVNVEKLIYLHIMGVPTYFGQIEVLKLCSSNNFSDKRVGYLALSLILNENSETLMLVTQTLKNDLHSYNPYVIVLALNAIANIASADITRDLIPIIQKLIVSENFSIKKKAIACLLKMVRIVPDVIDAIDFSHMKIFNENINSIFMTLSNLFIELKNQSALFPTIKKQLVYFRKFLTILVVSDFNPDFEISNMNDPLLQIKLIQLLKEYEDNRIPINDQEDIIFRIIRTLALEKNAHGAVLYECINYILGIEETPENRKLAINVLGNFLVSTKNNLKFVALNKMKSLKHLDKRSILHHQSMIIKCLQDADTSIGTRALELSSTLVHPENYQNMISEYLQCLQRFESENGVHSKRLSRPLVDKIFSSVTEHERDSMRSIDILFKSVDLCENTPEEISRSIIRSAKSLDSELKTEFVKRMWEKLRRKKISEASLNIALWAVGEFYENLDVATDETKKLLESLYYLSQLPVTQKSLMFMISAIYKIALTPNSRNIYSMANKLFPKLLNTKFIEVRQRAKEYINLLDPKLKNINEIYKKLDILNEDEFDILLLVYKSKSLESDEYEIKAEINNKSDKDISSVKFQVAVPRFLKLSMGPATGDTLPGKLDSMFDSKIRQSFVVVNTNSSKEVSLKIRLLYTIDKTERSKTTVCKI